MIAVILDIPKPETCSRCPFNFIDAGCMASDRTNTMFDHDPNEGRAEWCPLIEVDKVDWE